MAKARDAKNYTLLKKSIVGSDKGLHADAVHLIDEIIVKVGMKRIFVVVRSFHDTDAFEQAATPIHGTEKVISIVNSDEEFDKFVVSNAELVQMLLQTALTEATQKDEFLTDAEVMKWK